MRILAIETSCDDTGVAIVDVEKRNGSKLPKATIVANLIASQTKIHARWGGVVPNLAKNAHIESLPKLWKQLAANEANKTKKLTKLNFDFVAVTVGPGLEPALWAGIEFAKKISEELKVPIIGANHLEGHLYSFLLSYQEKIKFPAIVLLVSGGNTILVYMDDVNHWQILGKTKDDAVGEAFDKVARMLKLPYPGGPAIEALAKKGNPSAIQFPRPMLRDKNYDFSFSGLKTSVLYYLRDKTKEANEAKKLVKLEADVAASFQQAAIDVLVKKTERAAQEHGAESIIVCGGVAANTALRTALQMMAEKNNATFIAPAMEYNTDNAAMIAMAAYMQKSRKTKPLPLIADATLSL